MKLSIAQEGSWTDIRSAMNVRHVPGQKLRALVGDSLVHGIHPEGVSKGGCFGDTNYSKFCWGIYGNDVKTNTYGTSLAEARAAPGQVLSNRQIITSFNSC